MTHGLGHWLDETITKVHQSRSGFWYAVLDVGPVGYPSDPDYSTCSSKSREDAVKRCAAKIRAHNGRLSDYDIRYRYGKHWEQKS